MIRVKIANQQEVVPLDFAKLRETARVVLEGEEVNEDQIINALVEYTTNNIDNKQFLNHEESKDVLSFPMSGANARKLEGEIVLGAEVAKAQAEERGHEVGAELGLYVIHGLLHLCGYDDHDDSDIQKMRERERHYLAKLAYPNVA